jgi:hypothetical protein
LLVFQLSECPLFTADQNFNAQRMISLDEQEKTEQIRPDNPSDAAAENVASKKPFVEPEVSVPIDVLEATTLPQPVTSGATN